MLRINFDVTSCACAIFAGSAYVMVIPLVLVHIALALFEEGTTIVSSAGEQSVETGLTALPSKNDAAEVKNDALATATGIDRQQGTHREVHRAITVIHDATAQAVVSQDHHHLVETVPTGYIVAVKIVTSNRALHRAFRFVFP
ncbi:unnamed protein product [Heligmosomoides polygyrus]|uniref:Secreted protein n=1 Tax=Heligmosomoides polygyrus TaxID=6339 RepID=A0A183G728_HELPZ|nr:unnamed protein product [Heligmosomoides polygyrus]